MGGGMERKVLVLLKFCKFSFQFYLHFYPLIAHFLALCNSSPKQFVRACVACCLKDGGVCVFVRGRSRKNSATLSAGSRTELPLSPA